MDLDDLSEYAADDRNRGRSKPWLESIPEWPEIVEAYRERGIPGPVIRQYLIDKGLYTEEDLTDGRWQHLYKKAARRGRP